MSDYPTASDIARMRRRDLGLDPMTPDLTPVPSKPYPVNDFSGVSDEEFFADLALLEATPPAPESFDAPAALRRVLDVMSDWSEWAGTDNDPRSCTVRKFVGDLEDAIRGQQ